MNVTPVKRKRLIFDIETSPNIGLFWTAGWKLNIGPESIINERAIICICYKWAGQNKVHSLTWDKNQCDKSMLKKFLTVLNSADEIIGHNGDRYDLPWIRTRCLKHRLPMFPAYVTIDTLKFARSKFRFNSNKLDYIAKFLGFAGKTSTGYGLWKDVLLKNCQKALGKMVFYCKGDVTILENVFTEMSVHFPAKFHYGVKAGKDKSTCPNCGSDNIKISKTVVSAAGVKKHQTKCNDCGRYHTRPVSK
jgi:hypothetical protein